MSVAFIGDMRTNSAAIQSGENRRRFERRILRSNAFLHPKDRQLVKVRTFDVSAGGIGVISTVNLPKDQVCKIEFLLPLPSLSMNQYTPVSSLALVTHSVFTSSEDGFKIGLVFQDITSEISKAIEQYVKG